MEPQNYLHPVWHRSTPSHPGTEGGPPARVPRRDQLDLLEHCRRFALTLLLAPAGFGKSTLLQQWLRRHGRERCVLLSLARHDDDPARFFRLLGQALREVVPDIDTVSYNQLSADINLPAESVVESLLPALDLIRGELFIALDDFQHIQSPLIQRVTCLLLEQLPAHVHVIIASRKHPDFSLSRLKLEDRLLLIDQHDMRLTPEQLRALSGTLALSLDESHLQRVLAFTEGWIAGAKMALLAQSSSALDTLQHFNGSLPEMVDYFAHVVLEDLAVPDREFLLGSAVFEYLDEAVCKAFMHDDNAAGQLERIVALGLFLHPVEGRPGCYRYHPLFQDYLRNRLQREQPRRVPELHAAAAQHFIQAGEEEQALQHARAAGNVSAYMAMLKQSCERWLRRGDFAAILRWTSEMEEEQLLPESELMLPLISALILSRRFNQAQYYLSVLKDMSTPLQGAYASATVMSFLEIMLQLFQHDTDFCLGSHHEALICSAAHHDIRAFSLAIIAYHYLLHGDYRMAKSHARQAKVVLAHTGHAYLESYADLILVLCDTYTGNMISAMLQAEVNANKADVQRNSPHWVNAATALAVVRYEQNRAQEAQHMCEELIPVVSSACATEVIVSVYLILSRMLHSAGHSARSARLLSHLDRLLHLGNYDRFVSQMAFEEMRQAFADKDNERMQRLAAGYQLEARLLSGHWQQPQAYDQSWEYYGLTSALWLRQKNRLSEAAHVLEVLSTSLRQCGCLGRAAIAEANLIVVRQLQGNENSGLQLLRHLLRECGLASLNRRAFDEAPGLAALLARTQRHNTLSLPAIYLEMYGDLLVVDDPAPVAMDKLLLTSKEQQILELLSAGLSNAEISERTGTALSTTKWHIKNIFSKMGVPNRAAAISRVRQRQM